MADPGFSGGGGGCQPPTPKEGVPTYCFVTFLPKLRENERIWTEGGVPGAPGSATAQSWIMCCIVLFTGIRSLDCYNETRSLFHMVPTVQ